MLNEKVIREAAKAALTQKIIDQSKDIDCDCLLEFGFHEGFEAGYKLALEPLKQNQFWVIESDCGLYKHLFLSKEDAKAKLKELQSVMPNKLFRNFPIKIDNE